MLGARDLERVRVREIYELFDGFSFAKKWAHQKLGVGARCIDGSGVSCYCKQRFRAVVYSRIAFSFRATGESISAF